MSIGVIDGLLFLVYFLPIDNIIYYAASISLKFIIVFFDKNKYTHFYYSFKNNFELYGAILFAEMLSALLNGVDPMSSVRTFAFVANISITVCFVSRDYWRGIFFVGILNALIYLFYVDSGRISDHYGRFMYFNESHFNLGTEIFMAAAFSSVFIRPGIFSLICNCLFFYCVSLMQGRAGQLSIIISMLLCVNIIIKRNNVHNGFVYVMSAIFLLIASYNYDFFYGLINDSMRMDDDQRGAGTNASGRSEYWGTAISVWFDNFVFGAGSDYPSRLGVLQAHNFFLYPFAFYGIFGFFILFFILKRIALSIFLPNFYIITPMIPMLMFNDRFINLNIYPIVLYLIILTRYDSATVFGIFDEIEK